MSHYKTADEYEAELRQFEGLYTERMWEGFKQDYKLWNRLNKRRAGVGGVALQPSIIRGAKKEHLRRNIALRLRKAKLREEQSKNRKHDSTMLQSPTPKRRHVKDMSLVASLSRDGVATGRCDEGDDANVGGDVGMETADGNGEGGDVEMSDAGRDGVDDAARGLGEYLQQLSVGGQERSSQGQECENCKRREFAGCPTQYAITFERVPTRLIRNGRTLLRKVDLRQDDCVLCGECTRYLKKPEGYRTMTQSQKDHLSDWENSWPSFLYDVLSGAEQSVNGRPFYEIYTPKELWRFIPSTVRKFWVDSITYLKDGNGNSLYFGCTEKKPPSYFDDRTTDIDQFWEDINSYDLRRLLQCMKFDDDRKPIMLPDVLCPWGCSNFCFRGSHFNLAVLIQHHLRKAVLNMPISKWYEDICYVESSRKDYLRDSNNYDLVLLNEDWPIRPAVVFVKEKGLVVLTCPYHSGYKVTKRLYTHPPRHPDHNLCAEISDQLSPCVVQSRTCRPMRTGKYNSLFQMVLQQSSYSGVDSLSVSTEGRFTRPSVLLSMHESKSAAGRMDIRHLMERNVNEGIMTRELMENILRRAELDYPEGSLDGYVDGATYVSLSDSMKLQKNISESSAIDIIVERKQNNRTEEVEAACERSWSPAINFIQMEDATGFGYPLKAIKRCTSYDVDSPVMMMWMVASALVGSKDVWEAIDQKRGFFRYDGWDGYLLTHLYGICMKHDEITSPRGSPFKPSKCRSAESVLGHLKRFMPENMRRDSSRRRGLNDRNLFFKFSLDYVKKLLPRNVYPNILVCDPVELRNITDDVDLTDTNVIIVVDSKKSNGEDYQHPANTDDTIQVNGIQYEARVINHTATRMNAEIPDHFCGRRLCRHGGSGFPSWWEQRRYVESPVLMTHSETNSVFEERYWDESRYRAFASMIVYVRTKMPTVEELRDDFHQMLGGQTRARCQCNDFPLIVSSRGKEKGRKCMNENCSRKERYVCVNTSCATRLCDHCLEELPRSPTTVLAPPPADDVVEEGNVEDGMNDDDDNDGFADEHPSFRSCVLENRGHVENDYIDRVGADDEAVDEFFLGEYLTRSNFNPMDPQCQTEDSSADVIPTTNAGDFAYTVLDKNEKKRRFPCHILLNQVGVLLTRYNNRIEGTYAQKNFIQRIVSTICGLSFPLVYLMGTLFPRHFYAQAKHDPHAILGVPPLCCYNHKNHPFGMASTLDFSRTLLTHSSSSASNCHTTAAFLYDVQANKAMSNMDSRVIGRSGYMVDVMSAHGISARGKGETDLTESVDSHEAARDLAGAQPWSPSEQFLTFTCNQKKHPGISHLHAHKEGMAWTKFIPRYNSMSDLQKREVKRAFEQAYGSVLGRCWCEARKFWLEYLTYSINCIIGEAEHTFWRYELQEDDGGLAHIHGLRSLKKEHMSNEEVRDFVYSLQKCCVAELFPTNKIQEYIDEGLFENEGSWYTLTDLGKEILSHKHSERCKIRISDAEGEDSFKCKKPDPVRGRERPWEHELRPLPYTFSEECCAILEKCGLYEPPRPGQPQGIFKNQMFRPCRHFGPCDPKDTLNISPVNPKCFAATESMQNYQVLIGTNGAARYVVKYVTSLDAGNKATVWSAAHTGGGMRVENKFLHNTKIGRSKANEESASEMSRSNRHESGRKTSFFEMQQQILGYSEVMTTFNFCRISTKPLEHRSTTKMSLDDIGKLRRPDLPDDEQDDAYSTVSVAQSARLSMNLPGERCLRPNQELLYRHSGIKASSYDKVTQYGLRPVELLIVIQTLGGYYRWFHINPKTLSSGKIEDEKLSDEVRTTYWIDGLGRQVKLRVQAFAEVKDYLNGRNDTEWENVDRNAKNLILELIKNYSPHSDWNGRKYDEWVIDDGKRDLPIPVFSGVTPHNPVMFLLHLMLVCGEYETELDFRSQPTMRKSLLMAKLIGDKTDDESLEQYSIDLVNTVISEVLPRQPIALRLLDDFVVASKRLFDGVLKDDEIPITDLPPCILTELLDEKDKELQSFWEKKKGDQLSSIYKTLSGVANLPSKDEVMKCNRRKHALWPTPPLTGGFEQSEHQSAESYEEQQLVVKLGIKDTIDKYRIEIGPEATTFTKGLLIRGVPGSGKSHLAQYLALYAFSRGLRVMTTALMALRAVVLGGIHYHILAAVPTKNNSNVYRLAELAIESLRRKSQFLHLHILLTMDVLVIDEIGQLSAQQMSILDIILRKLRDTDIPFGGVLYEDSSIASSLSCKIIATCDHAQFQAIRGLPFFLSTHLLTDFNVVELRKSVRAHGDSVLQRIQDITRMSPSKLLENPELEVEFKSKAKACFRSARDWQDPIITPEVQRMYSLRKPTQEAQDEYVSSSIRQFDTNNVHYVLSRSTDIQRAVGSRAEFVPMTSRKLLNRINKEIKEPPRLLFWEGAMFEATRNGDGYNNAQLLLMIEVPSEATVRAKAPVKVMAAPAGVSYLDMSNGVPTREELEVNGWKQVSIRPAKELAITVMGIMGYRKQYAMTHLGASTINKQTGNTISGLCAIEMSSSCVPWEKPQIVVMLSRTTKGPDIIIVAENFNDAIDEMWNVITKGNQWTAYVENLLERLSIHPSKLTNMEEILSPEARVIDFSRTYPMRMCDLELPTDSSGYVYYIFSVREPERGYIGETKNLSHRLYTHNRGRGAKDTADVFYRPYSIAAYIFGLSHMDTQQRRRLEAKWKHYNVMSMNAGNKDVFDRIENGKKVVREHNTWADESEKISFAITVKRGAISGNN